MAKQSYAEQVNNLTSAIDIAVSVMREHPPKGFTSDHITRFVNTYLDIKNAIKNPEPQFKNAKSLAYQKHDVFTYFQEGAGKTVDLFWEKIKEHNLPFKRENRLSKIFKRGKITTQIEYDFVIDVMQPYLEGGIITAANAAYLNEMIAEFSRKKV